MGSVLVRALSCLLVVIAGACAPDPLAAPDRRPASTAPDAEIEASDDAAADDAAAPDAPADDAAADDAAADDAAADDAAADDAAADDAASPDAARDGGADGGRVRDGGADGGIRDVGIDAGAFPDAAQPDADPFPDAEEPPDAEIPLDLGPLGPGVSTLTGAPSAGDRDGVRGYARFDNPVNIELLANGDLAVADFYNARVARVTPQGDTTTMVRSSTFSRPFGLVLTSAGVLYIQTDRNTAGMSSGTLWRMNAGSSSVSVVATNLGRPRGLAAMDDGRLIFVDPSAHTVSLFDPTTRVRTLLAGRAGTPGFANGPGNVARFNSPINAVATSSRTFIISDSGNNRLRRMVLVGTTALTAVIDTFAGTGTATSTDGPRLTASLNGPGALAADAAGNVYFAETLAPTRNSTLRRVDTTGQVTTIAGTGIEGFADAVDPLEAQFFGMEGIAVTPDGRFLYVADGARGFADPYNRIRRVQLRP